MRDVVDRGGDKIDRDDVDLTALDPQRRQPRGQHPARLLEHLEEVIGPVDLVDLSAARVADNDARPIDPPGPAALFAHDALGLVLGAEVGVRVEPLGLVEHVLGPGPRVETRGGDRAHLVKATRLDLLRQLHRVASALDVGDLLRLGAGGHVIDGRQVEEVVDVAAQRQQIFFGDPQTGLREVARDRDDAGAVRPPATAQLLQAPP